MKRRSFVQAHGTGTPQNRTTESQILNGVARAFGIDEWPVAAIKCYVGHTMAAAGGDQLASSLGVFAHGILPGIATIDEVAADVERDHLRISREPLRRDAAGWDLSFLNAKGFGGNNATATIASPGVVMGWLDARHGGAALAKWRGHNEATLRQSARWDRALTNGHRGNRLSLRPRGQERRARPDRGRDDAHRRTAADQARRLTRARESRGAVNIRMMFRGMVTEREPAGVRARMRESTRQSVR